MIIDMHAHLGDICFPNGGELIEQKGVKKQHVFDVVTLSEIFLHPMVEGLNPESWVYKQNVIASMARNKIGTRENFKKSMSDSGVTLSIALPVPPYVTFADLYAASQKESSIIPFSGVDFTKEYDVAGSLKADVAAGAKGIKLHPVLQCEKLTSKKTFAAVETFACHDLPILLHTGVCHYFPNPEDRLREAPELGDIPYVRALVQAFPKVKFIIGHAGLTQTEQMIQLLGGMKNIWLECSFQNPSKIRNLIHIFGPDKILYGSDWPWGNRTPAIKIIKKTCCGDRSLEQKIFYENAEELMRLSTA
jgi:predicted TIM-barrel fold metal-dependent hydrolase